MPPPVGFFALSVPQQTEDSYYQRTSPLAIGIKAAILAELLR
jgi:hypothetical protein